MKIKTFPFAAGFACLLAAASLFSDFLSSNSPSAQNLEQFYQPPAVVHGLLQGKPVIHSMELKDPLDAVYVEDKTRTYPLQFFFRGYRYRLFGLISTDLHLLGRSRPPFYYPLGTDDLGRDVLARVLAGARTSVLVVAAGLLICSLIGIAAGAVAGLFGGWMDELIMRLSEFVLALPVLYILMASRSLLPARVAFYQALFLVAGTVAAVTWPPMARGIRGLVLQLKNSGYVEASRSLGGSYAHVFHRHMVPFLLPFILSQLAVAAPVFLLGEVVLSFLNIGFQDSGESWGGMLRGLKDSRVLTDYWWNLLPLGAIFLALLTLNMLGNRIRTGKSDEPILRM